MADSMEEQAEEEDNAVDEAQREEEEQGGGDEEEGCQKQEEEWEAQQSPLQGALAPSTATTFLGHLFFIGSFLPSPGGGKGSWIVNCAKGR